MFTSIWRVEKYQPDIDSNQTWVEFRTQINAINFTRISSKVYTKFYMENGAMWTIEDSNGRRDAEQFLHSFAIALLHTVWLAGVLHIGGTVQLSIPCSWLIAVRV